MQWETPYSYSGVADSPGIAAAAVEGAVDGCGERHHQQDAMLTSDQWNLLSCPFQGRLGNS